MHAPRWPFDPQYAAEWDAAQEVRRSYAYSRHPETGLMVVTFKGKRIGTAQTEAAARLIIRNHKRRAARHD